MIVQRTKSELVATSTKILTMEIATAVAATVVAKSTTITATAVTATAVTATTTNTIITKWKFNNIIEDTKDYQNNIISSNIYINCKNINNKKNSQSEKAK